MRTDVVKRRIEDIKAWAGDPKIAHGMEDDLRDDFICEIAGLCRSVSGEGMLGGLIYQAGLIAKTSEIDFDRWYA